MKQAATKTPPRPHVKKGDQVQVMAGKAKGQVGEVLRVDRQRQFAYIKDVNLQKRHTKPRRQGEPGGIISIEGPIHLSNVLGFCPVCNKGVRKLAAHTLARHEQRD
ncbi:MAG: 50S ribosomal protein L24 [Candidatus Lambdaproteobacteria bacterium]|nr:50S ribosomal protein L24 [Candidatus Lambdaproteobacteria bacterium]